jgi:hypothetical protein
MSKKSHLNQMMSKDLGKAKTGCFRLRTHDGHCNLSYEIIRNCWLLDDSTRQGLRSDVRQVVNKSWGDLGEALIAHVVDKAKWILLVYKEEKVVGVSAIHKMGILGRNVYDYELIAVVPELRGTGMMRRMNDTLFRRIFFDNLIHNKKIVVELLFTTANMQILGSLAKIAHFIYPDPFKYSQKSKKIPPPDDETWKMAEAFIRHDVPPGMKIVKDGCVVEGAYDETPWLIYDKAHAPLSMDRVVNEFAATYLQYHQGLGKKVVVRAKITPGSIVKFYMKLFFK